MTRTQLYENFAANIELERERLKLTQQKMADALQISLSKYKILIANPFEANIDIYLAHQIQKLTGKTVRELCGDDLPELEMIRYFRELPRHRQEAIRYMIEIEYQLPPDGRDNSTVNDEDCVTVFVPTGNMEDGMTLDSRDFITANISEYKKNSRERVDCGVKITSNHLHPVYMKGDVLLISKRAPRDGDIGIFIYKETRQIYIREFKQTSPCELRPINSYGETIYVDSSSKADMDKWIKFGTVLTVMR
ncbi:MAG: hypothetical protein Q4D29_09670 [Lachnospiraceae bacterium]|nr:hypothetical protein [Lachnospiraceae bacterium]